MNRGRHKKKLVKYPNTWLTKVMTEELLDLLFQRAHEQGKHPSLEDIERYPTSSSILAWDHTPEGWSFWNSILSNVEYYKCNNCIYDRC